MNISDRMISSINVDPVHRPHASGWIRIWDERPEEGDIVPVWDGEYIYYAVYWDMPEDSFFSIIGDPNICPEDHQFRKKVGEKMYPIEWMRIKPPPERL